MKAPTFLLLLVCCAQPAQAARAPGAAPAATTITTAAATATVPAPAGPAASSSAAAAAAPRGAPAAAVPQRAAAEVPAARTALPANDGPRCSGDIPPQHSMALQPGKSTLLRLPEAVASRSIGNPAVAQAMLVAPDTLYLAGVDIGSTNMVVQLKSGKCSLVDLVVGMDVAGLQATLAQLMPHEKNIRVTAAADALVLSGTVEDGATLLNVLELAHAYVRRPVQALASPRAPEDKAPQAATVAAAPAGAVPAVAGLSLSRVVNLLSVTAPQQVMLEVKIAEVSKTLLDKLEAGVMLHYAGGGWAATVLSNFLTGTAGSRLDVGKGDKRRFTLDAERKDGLVRILAEPTVMAISGQEGSFLAGGKIFIPVAQERDKVTLEEKEFGVGLRFTPTVLAGGRINLRVAPEVSELSREGVGISANGFNGGAILPLITTRRATTTVQLYDGQSFAIGGLIRNTQNTSVKGVPLLGELPVLGALFRSTDFQHDRSELLFVITAHLVKPLPPGQPLPTGGMAPPERGELFLGARPQGAQP
ncbi:type II and III secretion system protein family protein [Massilia sp. Root418]|uniref:type II and III secretion system protein family protein n=1 Tax=Massilia sp. Root418 TaxID=1736532 RepID=UPI0009EB4164|nr:type II and III secretion system protein family protein [Massilia sp. Root418]